MKSKLIKESFGEDIYYVEFENEYEAGEQEYALRDGWGHCIDTEVDGNRLYAMGDDAKEILTKWYGADKVVEDNDYKFSFMREFENFKENKMSSRHENQKRLVEAVAMLKDNNFTILNERERKFRPSPELRAKYKEIPDELDVIKANAQEKMKYDRYYSDFLDGMYGMNGLEKLDEDVNGEISTYLKKNLDSFWNIDTDKIQTRISYNNLDITEYMENILWNKAEKLGMQLEDREGSFLVSYNFDDFTFKYAIEGEEWNKLSEQKLGNVKKFYSLIDSIIKEIEEKESKFMLVIDRLKRESNRKFNN